MLLPPEAFTHVPELLGLITPPEESRLRMTLASFDTFDALAAKIGLPPTWRRTHEEREAVRQQALAGRLNADLWVFAYGAVMWDPGFHATEIRRATAHGWHRSFRLRVPSIRAPRGDESDSSSPSNCESALSPSASPPTPPTRNPKSSACAN